MKLYLIIMLLSIILIECQFGCRKSQIEALPVIDILKNYPKKEIHLQSIADIEYVPLETTDDVLLGQMCLPSYVSDKYIVLWELAGNIFIFNRNGGIISHFNRRGQGSQEYSNISGAGIVFDEKNEEIFVFNTNTSRILVYLMSGEYKRTLNISTDLTINTQTSAYNFDDETLLIYDNLRMSRVNYSEKPYMLLSKKDGSIVSILDINLPVRYSTTIPQIVDPGNGGRVISAPLTIDPPNNRRFGQDFVIADISSDTIYRLTQSRNLSSWLVRKPSVHSSEPRMVWTTPLITNKFLILQKSVLDFIAAEKGRSIPSVTLMYAFETGQISEVSFVNDDFATRAWSPYPFNTDVPKNVDVNLLHVPKLKEAYEEKRLKGKLEKLTETLDEEDNPVIMIVKFK